MLVDQDEEEEEENDDDDHDEDDAFSAYEDNYHCTLKF
jgi:hypothetical protein